MTDRIDRRELFARLAGAFVAVPAVGGVALVATESGSYVSPEWCDRVLLELRGRDIANAEKSLYTIPAATDCDPWTFESRNQVVTEIGDIFGPIIAPVIHEFSCSCHPDSQAAKTFRAAFLSGESIVISWAPAHYDRMRWVVTSIDTDPHAVHVKGTGVRAL